tara:strand:+ start:361 stop:927 length:567 start_codon:yes stop_codon:yes gene_type:complete
MKLYIFDFDGTISKKDSFILFTFFTTTTFRLLYFYVTILFYYPVKSKSKLKESFFDSFKGCDLKKFEQICSRFENKVLNKTIKKSFLNYISSIEKDSIKIVVSASISTYLKPWCNRYGLHLISTELEVINGLLTGKFSTPNCNGKEKVKRILQLYNLDKFDEVHVFGNSKGDIPMLELGTHKYYKFFK